MNISVLEDEIYDDYDDRIEFLSISEVSFNIPPANSKINEKGFHSISKINKGKKETVDYYETVVLPKNLIRNAITGERYKNCRVGSCDENLFFKVSNVTAVLKNRDPHVLFYNNPEQWEKHFGVVCPSTIKETWFNKYHQEIRKRNKILSKIIA